MNTRTDSTALKDLTQIPGIGPRLAEDFIALEIQRVTELRGQSPEQLYEKLCTLRNRREDRCVLYAFRCAVYFATEAKPKAELLKWWNWKDQLKAPRRNRGDLR